MIEILGRFLIPKSRVGKRVFVLMSGTAVAQLITAVSMPLVTRLYTPEMIGLISVYLSFFNFWLVLLSWRYEGALLIAEDEEESHHIFRLGLILAVLTAILAIPALWTAQHVGFLGFDILPYWAPLVGFVSLLGYGLFMLYRSWLLRLQEVRVISISAVSRSSANVLTRILAGFAQLGVQGLFFAEVVGSWAALGAARVRTLKLLQDKNLHWDFYKMKIIAAKYKRYPLYEAPSVLVNQLATALPIPIVLALYGPKAAGWFGLARLLFAIPNGQIGKAVGDVFQMELGHCVRTKNLVRAERLFYKFTLGLTVIGAVPLVVAIYAAPALAPFLFGIEWAEMGRIVALMAPWMFAALVVSSLSRALSVLQQQQWKLIYDVSSLVVVISLYFASLNYLIGLFDFIYYLSFGMVLAYVIYFFLIFGVLKKAVINSVFV